MKRILIIEDSPANMTLIVTILESAGYQLFQTAQATESIEIAKAEHPDLIVMDIQLPGMDGIEATQRLKKEPGTMDIPVLALTAFAMKGDRERILGAGCDAYIEKPIRYKEFLSEIARLLITKTPPCTTS